ncbi:MAG: MmcQ/YjbR family DNA-binding protein [Clostridia bacterium]|nr:MmcQ/YjbR family DNA-binding protein [Clostridia bacterium]
MEKTLLKDKKINYCKLLKYGFMKKGKTYLFSTLIFNNQFELLIEITSDEKIKTKTIETSTQDEYILHLTDATGEFVGKVRSEYEKVLQDISVNCFEKNIFKSKQALQVIEYVSKTYNDNLKYLWQKFPNNAVWRRKDNNKWYGALLVVSKRKLGIDSDDIIEFIDLRADTGIINKLIDNKTIYEGYHMNKKHWITICLDESLPIEEIYRLLDNSYALAKKMPR